MRRLLIGLVVLGFVGLGVFLLLTAPNTIEAAALPQHTPDAKNGEVMFYAGGCASCHAPPATATCDDPKYNDKHNLAGGRCLKTPFGTFYAPNISPDKETGIGGWSNLDFVNAMTRGVAPDGAHYYPAFPFTSYQRMRIEDVLDLKAYLDTLPAVKSEVPPHDLALPFQLRRGLGLWKLLFLDGKPFVADPAQSAEVNRGRYLVEGPGHCGECHTSRNFAGGPLTDKRLAGGPAPEGDGWIPNITPAKDGIGHWSAGDIESSLETGFTPEFDSFGGPMVAVQQNMALLSAADRKAIAAYLKSLPAIENPRPAKK
jgi:mono/diheme cytochrome c family protein